MPLPVLLLTWCLFSVILVFFPLLTCGCYLFMFCRTLSSNIFTQSKSHDDSTPDTGSSKPKNTLGYEKYNITRYVAASSRLPTSLRTHPAYFQTWKAALMLGNLGRPIFATAGSIVDSQAAAIPSNISSSSMRVAPVGYRSMRCMVGRIGVSYGW